MPDDSSFSAGAALHAWRGLLGGARFLTADECEPYTRNCIGASRNVLAVLRPRSEHDVVDIVKIAAQFSVPLYPISKGHNWGYGAALPVTDNCAIVDLSDMDRVVEHNDALAIVTVQPGVTTGQLDRFLSENGSDLMVPVTGAGPTGSLVGNALERGYGITPTTDHFSAVLALRAVLPDGTVYQGAMADAGGANINKLHKWGIGPYLDGLFSQGNFGIVTEMTIGLRRRPDQVEAVVFEADGEKTFKNAVTGLRQLLQRYPGVISAFNLMNKARVESMLDPARKSRSGVPDWVGIGALYGGRRLSASLRSAIRRELRGCKGVRFFSERKIERLKWLSTMLPARLIGRDNIARLQALSDALDMFAGHPRTTALRLVYPDEQFCATRDRPLDPAGDGCGLIWYAPLVPVVPECVKEYTRMVDATMARFDFDPMVTLTTLSCRVFDSSVPILFDQKTEANKARDCYQSLLEEGRKIGCLPYRLNVDVMQDFHRNVGSDPSDFLKSLKRSVDPTNCIAPGRYETVQ